ncbi:MAG: hypothetical protein A3B47_03840 [Candidatus Levybacteria bacterium RIFCSPLOWO2_01_FULL_39_24]|nr:MAG: hypothetical protein A2800_03645 [Candidatus Levybacteria bacterium RIFCSPHIGHO2_01_FULL_40_16]OGH28179.1 MAG: hypothetical protein A3E12_04350 [Candidatus Levybacteria bacterium RIFCSPHIGHO2_12_FULL_39_9]OGH46367.1 MAG: hypothetical protein A3B47_03840 [Candidatus Levybacteria bacterium RIFCSPLOWO2_01_FULL_39_24]
MHKSFFGKPLSIRRNMQRIDNGSTSIRAEQIAQYLGAKFNPAEGYEDDICIYVKPSGNENFAKNSYIDIVDGFTLVNWLKTRPQFPIIAVSKSAYDYLTYKLPGHRIILIPQQHCNFERTRRTRKEINTVGIIGLSSSFMYPFDEMEKKLKSIGMNLFTGFVFKNRMDVVNLYKQIDIQITWRTLNWRLKNPLKLYNAASFGIPTVGYREDCYREFENYYVPVKTIDELISEVNKFKNADYYNQFSEKIAAKAEDWHISKIAKLYNQL